MDHIDRLIGLSKVWCATKFFHPFLAYRHDIDWDQTLIRTLPEVLAAENADEYASAMQTMLSALGDSVSRVRRHRRESQGAAPGGMPFSHDGEGDVLVVSFGAVRFASKNAQPTGRPLSAAVSLTLILGVVAVTAVLYRMATGDNGWAPWVILGMPILVYSLTWWPGAAVALARTSRAQ